MAFNDDGRALDAGFFAIGHIEQFDLVFPALGPACVHTQEHIGPVLALGAAGAGMDFEIGIVLIGFAGEQRLDLTARGFLLERADLLLAFLDRRLVRFHLAEFDQRDGIFELALKTGDGGQTIFKISAFAHDLLRGFGIVPEIGMFGLRVQLGQTLCGSVEVKDASSAGQRTAWWLRGGIQFQRAFAITPSIRLAERGRSF